MDNVKFKLEDGSFLECGCEADSNFVMLKYKSPSEELVSFKLHRIQVQAFLKMVNEPLRLGIELKK